MSFSVVIFILSVLFLFFGWLFSLDLFISPLPESISKHSDSYTKACIQTALVLVSLIPVSFVVFTIFKINVSKIVSNLPFTILILGGYIISLFHNELKVSKSLEKILAITDASYHVADYHYYDYHLIDYQHRLNRFERKLSTLKSFSLLPVILILINNFPTVLDSFIATSKRNSSDYGNIALATICIIYFITTYQSYRNCQHQTLMITQLEQKRLMMKYPKLKKRN